ncbi:MAG: cache domain-containing protein, partial [Treponema sp.]|nr:cache domain-containing protein [Treponema sp.]
MKLSVRVPLLIGLVVLATSGAIALFALRISTSTLTNSVVNALFAENEANAKIMDTYLNGEANILYEIANRPRIRTLNWDIVRGDLLSEVERLEVMELGLMLPDGTYRAVVTNDVSNGADRDYFKKAMKGEINIDIIVSRVTGEPVFMFAAPIYQSNENNAPIIGVLVAQLDGIHYLTDILVNNLKVSMPSGYCYIMDISSGQGTMIAHQNRDMVKNRFTPEEEAKKNPEY